MYCGRFQEDLTAEPTKFWGENFRLSKIRELVAKPIVAINHKTGEILYFETQYEAASKLCIDQSSISSVLNGNGYSTDGWWFKFVGDESVIPKKFGFDAIREKRDVKVFATHLYSGEKRTFRNCTVADSELGIYKGAAASIARGERTSAANWWFSFDEGAKPPTEFKGALVAKARSKPVVALHIATNTEQIYPSAKLAGGQLGISRAAISKAIKGELNSVKGYRFKFV